MDQTPGPADGEDPPRTTELIEPLSDPKKQPETPAPNSRTDKEQVPHQPRPPFALQPSLIPGPGGTEDPPQTTTILGQTLSNPKKRPGRPARHSTKDKDQVLHQPTNTPSNPALPLQPSQTPFDATNANRTTPLPVPPAKTSAKQSGRPKKVKTPLPVGVTNNQNAAQDSPDVQRLFNSAEFPPHISETHNDKCQQAFTDAVIKESSEKACAVCGLLVTCYSLYAPDKIPSSKLLRCSNPGNGSLGGTKPYSLKMIDIHRMSVDYYLQRDPKEMSVETKTVLTEHFLDPRGILSSKFIVCFECVEPLKHGRLPALCLSTAYVGNPPPCFDDLTYAEIMCIAPMRLLASITTIRKSGLPLGHNVMRGNIWFIECNTRSFYDLLPVPLEDLEGTIPCTFFATRRTETSSASQVFRIRRDKVLQCLQWSVQHNPYYRKIKISMDLLQTLPTDGIPEGFLRFVNSEGMTVNSEDLKEEEGKDEEGNELEDCGITSSACVDGDANFEMEQADLLALAAAKMEGDVLVYPTSGKFAAPQKDPGTWAMAFPHLFPYGVGALDSYKRSSRGAFQKHVGYLLNQASQAFAKDKAFHFATWNVFNRRTVAESAYFMLRSDGGAEDSALIAKLTAEDYTDLSKHLQEKTPVTCPNQQALLNRLKICTKKVMGSNEDRRTMRRNIKFMTMLYGLPTFFVTINPADLHNPIFLRFAGVDLDLDTLKTGKLPENYPTLSARLKLLADNPVAASKFYDSFFRNFFKFLIGYEGLKDGQGNFVGVLGEPLTYYGTVEEQGRKALHLHCLIWIKGADHERILKGIRDDPNFLRRFLAFIDSCICTDDPAVKYRPSQNQLKTYKSLGEPTCPYYDEEEPACEPVKGAKNMCIHLEDKSEPQDNIALHKDEGVYFIYTPLLHCHYSFA